MFDTGPNAIPVDPNATTEVDELSVVAPPRKPLNYDNRADAEAVQAALANMPKVSGAGANPGLWGLLPEGRRHGTLRNVLGAIGDAFLVQSGADPIYGPRMERKQEGMAMAGYAQKPETAIERMAALGTPDAMKHAQSMMGDTRQRDIAEQNAEYQNQYRQDNMQLRRDQEADLSRNRDDNIIVRMAPYAGGLLTQAQTPEQYARAYEQVNQMAQRVNPRYTALDFGALDPKDWKPGIYQGVTGNQVVTSEDREKARETSERNNIRTTTTSRENNMRSTGTSAANNQRSIAARGAGTGGTPSGLNPRTAPGRGGGAAPAASQRLTPQQAARLPRGTKFIGTDGKEYTRK